MGKPAAHGLEHRYLMLLGRKVDWDGEPAKLDHGT
jgi:hypothetical protein